jgi:hypothetical protein
MKRMPISPTLLRRQWRSSVQEMKDAAGGDIIVLLIPDEVS